MKYIQKSGKIYKPTKQGKEISLAPQNVYTLAKDRIKFWEDMSKEISWIEPWKTSYEGKAGNFSWFKEGKLNLCYNAVDRHLDKPNKPAIIFIPENPKEKKQIITYQKLFEMVNQAACITPFGAPVVPEVYSINAMSSAFIGSGFTNGIFFAENIFPVFSLFRTIFFILIPRQAFLALFFRSTFSPFLK